MSRVFDFIQRVLLKQTLTGGSEEREERARFIGKFQQITSPVAAKGIEDTAFYVYNRLVSLNEVGGDPTRFGLEPTAVHALAVRAAASMAVGALGDVNTRYEARRRPTGAPERSLGNSRRVEGGGDEVARAQSPLPDRRRRRRRTRCERRVPALPDAGRRVAV